MSNQESDRRVHDRRPLRIPARVLLPNDQAFEVRTMDIGAGGMGIIAGANPKAGTVFAIQFNLPGKTGGGSPLHVKVKVANSVLGIDEDGFKIGLQFLGLDPASERIIRQYVS
jgi:c-di-GMP-binding flagellar brake protein YcgR